MWFWCTAHVNSQTEQLTSIYWILTADNRLQSFVIFEISWTNWPSFREFARSGGEEVWDFCSIGKSRHCCLWWTTVPILCMLPECDQCHIYTCRGSTANRQYNASHGNWRSSIHVGCTRSTDMFVSSTCKIQLSTGMQSKLQQLLKYNHYSTEHIPEWK